MLELVVNKGYQEKSVVSRVVGELQGFGQFDTRSYCNWSPGRCGIFNQTAFPRFQLEIWLCQWLLNPPCRLLWSWSWAILWRVCSRCWHLGTIRSLQRHREGPLVDHPRGQRFWVKPHSSILQRPSESRLFSDDTERESKFVVPQCTMGSW